MLSLRHWTDSLEFFSIKVADGPLTSRLQQLREGHGLHECTTQHPGDFVVERAFADQ